MVAGTGANAETSAAATMHSRNHVPWTICIFPLGAAVNQLNVDTIGDESPRTRPELFCARP